MTLKNEEQTLKLNKSFLVQYQGIMTITEKQQILGFTQKILYVKTVNFDEKKWQNHYLPELTSFYFYLKKIEEN